MTTMTARKWTSTAGPIQTKRVAKALDAIANERHSIVEVSGVQDGRTAEEVVRAYQAAGRRKADGTWDFSVSRLWRFPTPSGPRPDIDTALQLIGEKYEYTITRANAAAIVADAERMLPSIVDAAPIIDQRRTPTEDAELETALKVRRALEEQRDQATKAAREIIRGKMPTGAERLIVAEYREDTSWGQTDYWNSETIATYAIGWRYGRREDFRQLRAAAVAFFGTVRRDRVGECKGGSEEHPCRHRGGVYGDHAPRYDGDGPHGLYVEVDGTEVASLTEHRDNYSMGDGNYLSTYGNARGGTGWLIRSSDLSWASGPIIDALPAVGPTASEARAAVAAEGIRVTASSVRSDYVEVRFPAKPDADVLEELRAAGFRWAVRSRCWYGPAARLPERYREVQP